MKKILMITGFVAFSLILFVVLPICNFCEAQEQYPSRPITLIVGYSAGGAADVPMRALAEVASGILKQPIVVVNKPGGGSAVAYAELTKARPDGYTIALLSTGAILAPLTRELPYNPVTDITAVIHCTLGIYGVVVRADSPFKTLKDLTDFARANPNKIKYASPGAGTPQHLIMVILSDLAKVKWTHIPYGGTQESIAALLGGHIDALSGASEFKPHVIAGRLRALGIASDTRLESLPNVPTFIEQGYNFLTPSYVGIGAPRDVPKDRVKILHDAFHKAMYDPRFIEVNKKFDQELVYMNTDDAQKRVKQLYEYYGKVIKGLESKN
jgi:tripartite-type tricarboxylate transporter receptor subunit TctC